jgi:hypothetical protein
MFLIIIINKKKNVDTLPKHRPYDCTIELVERAQPPFRPIYNLLQNILATLHEYIDENLKKRFIQHSKSLIGSLILFVKKNDDSFRMCVDYHGLNRLIIKNQYLLPLILGLLDQFNHAKVYTKIDLRGTYNLVCIWKGDQWKMVFKTCFDHFEYVVMPFGCTNVLVVFQRLMNDVFHEYLDDFMVYYVDDIFIFSNNMEDHECHVCLVLEKL